MSYIPLDNTQSINTNNPEQEIWNYISQFESEYYVRKFAEERISTILNNFPQDLLKQAKESNNLKQITTKVEVLEPLQCVTSSLVSEIAGNAMQARDFYNASKNIPMLSRPILLFYAFEKLADLLIMLTFNTKDEKVSHRLSYPKGKHIEIKPRGLFQRFHDCYSFDISIYTKKCSFKLDNLVSAGPLRETELFSLISSGSVASNRTTDENTNKHMSIHELDREFIFLFVLSILSRYRVNEWNELIAGKKSSSVIEIKRYLQSIQIFFPNLVINYLFGKRMLFYQWARLGADE